MGLGGYLQRECHEVLERACGAFVQTVAGRDLQLAITRVAGTEIQKLQAKI